MPDHLQQPLGVSGPVPTDELGRQGLKVSLSSIGRVRFP